MRFPAARLTCKTAISLEKEISACYLERVKESMDQAKCVADERPIIRTYLDR